MQLLHDIRIAALERFIWAVAIGANNRVLGRNGGTNWNPVYHAYLLPRGTPPPPPEGLTVEMIENNLLIGRALPTEMRPAYNNRYFWSPWVTSLRDLPREIVLNPICGPITSASQAPRLRMAYPETWRNPILCADCRRLAPDTEFQRNLMDADAWRNRTVTARMLEPDPVSGL